MCQKPILTLFNKLLLLVLMISPVHANDNTLTPLEHFARLPIVKKPVVSPNGKRIAFTMMIKGKPQLIVRELLRSGGKKPEPVVPINAEDYFFHHYTWANDNRLVASIRATQAINGSLYNFTRPGSIGRKGENPVLFKMRPNPWGYYRQSARLISRLKDDPDHILATVDDNPKRWAAPEVHRINIKTGEKTLVQSNRLGIRRWLVDANGRVRIGVKYSAKPGSSFGGYAAAMGLAKTPQLYHDTHP